MSPRWLTIVGIGDGGFATLTPEARAALGTATTIFGGKRHLAMLGEHRARRVEWLQPFARSLDAIAERRGQPTVVLATGDPMWFGVGATLARSFPAEEMRVLSAPSAFSLAAARLGWPLEETICLTVHGRPLEAVTRHLQPDARLLVLSEGGESPRALARLLTSRGYGPSRLTVLEHMGGPKERVRETSAGDFDLGEVADLNTVAVLCRPGRAAEPRPMVPGLPDESFIHDGKMTKRVLRALAIAALAPMPGDLLWDVGAGSGSISVEWLRAGRGLRAFAIEPVEARRRMIAENAAAFGVPELQIVAGHAPNAFAALEAPDAVFLGGGLSDGVFDAAFAALRPGGRIVAHAVTLESEAILTGLHAEHGGELMRVAVEKAEPVGPYRGFKPSMTVAHWHLTKAPA
ncbi:MULTISPECIES: bifunctional cobalt-precorrin-7 (C(5))-methyltransferase/cobalt-precorrin-6B (C(15))-methyltransferase [unclassified Aureimonas]|uniref:bifunctional cobalt-precorrin-7 (C(5))-methyltransferase/cobalt-precorrin-6B (C(15))-methyltransferase n=1 Tax=unclassified Aureimonas TaxID=2615206 RepID=UPI0006FC8AE4|nr:MULTISPECIES: bifunctional cobalt-precorrin-7 (C(5))-methyltransferase/cobalt-precorrin-6B (C(15))-methyltransferase [unclassified Aureimonas]KQT64117.1 precorrin-6Y C5,15-methyltransferase [Aureimonas sp. Leaf427]KQT81306.1 precorrin-6Y C5,15-methyltransferase [Aureimonas sp. Leaf460]